MATSASDTTHSVAVVASDVVDWSIVPIAVPANSPYCAISCVFMPTTPGTYVVMGGDDNSLVSPGGAIQYHYIIESAGLWTAPEPPVYQVTRSMGTIKNLYVKADGNLAAGNTLVFNLRCAGGNTGITCTIAAGASTASDTAHIYAPVYLALMNMMCQNPLGANNYYVNWGFTYTQNGSGNSAQVAASKAEHDISVSLSGGNFSASIDGGAPVTTAFAGSIPNLDTPWYFLYNYYDYGFAYAHDIRLTTGGTERLRYDPNTMIIGTNLPDRTNNGGYENGTFTWGTKPAGISVILGSMSGSGSSGGVAVTPPARDVLPEVTVSEWFGDGTVTKASTLANPIRPFITMVSDNTTLTEIQVWRWMGVVLLVFVTVSAGYALRGHQGITAIIMGAFLGGLVAFDSNIFPMWLLVLTAGCLIGGLIAERSPSL